MMIFRKPRKPGSRRRYSVVTDQPDPRQLRPTSAFLQPISSKTTSLFRNISSSWNQKTKFFHNDRWCALSGCMVHIPAVAITATLMTLNIRNVYYEDFESAEGQNFGLNAFQFAAKIHDILIVLSLSSVALTILQFELLRDGGVSLDEVLVGFQINNLGSFLSLELWMKTSDIVRVCSLSIIMVLATLAALVGPSSAILMLPSIGWWSFPWVPNPELLYYLPLYETLWPLNVTQDTFWPPDCTFNTTIMPYHCPASGLQMFVGQAEEFAAGYGSMLNSMWNFTAPMGDFGYERFISGGVTKNGQEFIGDNTFRTNEIYAQTTSSLIASILTNALSLISYGLNGMDNKFQIWLHNGSRTLAPRTVVTCNSSTLENLIETGGGYSRLDMPFPIRNQAKGNEAENIWGVDVSQLLEVQNSSDSLKVLWMAPTEDFNPRPSIGAAMIGPSQGNSSSDIEVGACLIFASWYPEEVYFIPGDNYIYSLSNWTDDSLFEEEAFGNSITEGGLSISLDLDWANLALPPDRTIINLTSSIRERLPEWGYYTPFTMALAFLITDALGRLGEDVLVTHEVVSQPLSMKEIIIDGHSGKSAFGFTWVKYGYSYTLKTNIRILSAVILLTHAFVALTHTTLVVWFGWNCADLNSLRDLLLAAFKAPPPAKALNLPGQSTKDKNRFYTLKAKKKDNSEIELECEDIPTSRSLSRDEESVESSIVLQGTDHGMTKTASFSYTEI